MSKSFIKKIISPEEFEKVIDDINVLSTEDDDKNAHVLDLRHEWDLIKSSIGHDSLLLWSIHVWAHFNGETWDGIFIASLRFSEKFNKKMFEEYLWYSKKSNSGIKLYKQALSYAKKQNSEFVSVRAMEKNPQKEKFKKFLKTEGFEKDYELFVKRI
jgi:hypothetical protein